MLPPPPDRSPRRFAGRLDGGLVAAMDDADARRLEAGPAAGRAVRPGAAHPGDVPGAPTGRACRRGPRRASRCRSPRRCGRSSRRSRSARRGGRRGARCGSTSRARCRPDWTDPGTRPELVVDLGFAAGQPGFQAEGLAYAPDGRVARRHRAAQRRHVPLPAGPGSAVDLYVEAASNPDVGERLGVPPRPRWATRRPPATDPLYRLGARRRRRCSTCRCGSCAQDVWTLSGLVARAAGGPAAARRGAAGAGAGGRRGRPATTWPAPPGRAGPSWPACWPARPTPSAHRVHAVGHAHIDSAWLWPVRETVRKVARTFANVVALMEPASRLVFAASSAQQYAWLQRAPPGAVRAGPSSAWPRAGSCRSAGCGWSRTPTCPAARRWPASSWPASGSSSSSSGVEPLEVWLPDSFGYSAALPQIIAAAGVALVPHPEDLLERDERDAAPHVPLGGHRRHPGLHALPAGGHLQLRAVRGRAGPGAAPVRREGPGQHLAGAVRLGRRRRRADPGDAGRRGPHAVPGGLADGADRPRRPSSSPRPRRSTRARRCGPASCTWSSTAAPTPRRPAPSAATGAASTCCARPSCGRPRPPCAPAPPYPYDVLQRCWHTVLLQQFHDILPGTSIAWVHQEAEREYARVAAELEAVIARSRWPRWPGERAASWYRQRRALPGGRRAGAGRLAGRLAGRIRRGARRATGDGTCWPTGGSGS